MLHQLHIIGENDNVPSNWQKIDVSSYGEYAQLLSPFKVMPQETPDGIQFTNVENLWQFSKVYWQHIDAPGIVDYDLIRDPVSVISQEWYEWREVGASTLKARRFPFGREAKSQWEYVYYPTPTEHEPNKGLLFKRDEYNLAREQIYIPAYTNALKADEVRDLFLKLLSNGPVALHDPDSYNYRMLGKTYADVVNDQSRSLSHAVVLERQIRIWLEMDLLD